MRHASPSPARPASAVYLATPSVGRGMPRPRPDMPGSYGAGRGGLRLRRAERLDPAGGEVEQIVEQVARERLLLGRRLHLDEPAVPGHDDVHVRLGRGVLLVVEVEHGLAADDPDRDRRDRRRQRLREAEAVERACRGDPGAGDRGAARAAVRLENVAVEPQRALPERLEVAHRAQGPADEALDLDRPPVRPPARDRALRPLAGRGREHRVLRCHPAAPALVQPARHALLDRRRAQHDGLALRVEDRAVRLLEVVDAQVERPELVRPPTAAPHAAAASRVAISTCSAASIGSWRKRRPVSRKSSGSPVVRKR